MSKSCFQKAEEHLRLYEKVALIDKRLFKSGVDFLLNDLGFDKCCRGIYGGAIESSIKIDIVNFTQRKAFRGVRYFYFSSFPLKKKSMANMIIAKDGIEKLKKIIKKYNFQKCQNLKIVQNYIFNDKFYWPMQFGVSFTDELKTVKVYFGMLTAGYGDDEIKIQKMKQLRLRSILDNFFPKLSKKNRDFLSNSELDFFGVNLGKNEGEIKVYLDYSCDKLFFADLKYLNVENNLFKKIEKIINKHNSLLLKKKICLSIDKDSVKFKKVEIFAKDQMKEKRHVNDILPIVKDVVGEGMFEQKKEELFFTELVEKMFSISIGVKFVSFYYDTKLCQNYL